MRTHTPFYAAAILALATLIGCGSTEQQKFPCKAGEVLTAVGVCAAPGDLVPKEKTCAAGMLQASDGTCVPPVSPDEPWTFPCTSTQVLNATGACVEQFPCASGNVLQADGSCVPLSADDLAHLKATSRVYASQDNTQVEYRDTDGQNGDGTGSFGTGYFTFHAVGEPFVITNVNMTWFSHGERQPEGWLLTHAIGYQDEGGLFHQAFISGHPQPQNPQTIRLYVPKDGKADLTTIIFVQREVCRTFNGFATFSVGFELARIEAVGLTTGKRVTLSERLGEYVRGNRTFVCGNAPDPRLAPRNIGNGTVVKGNATTDLYYAPDGRTRFIFPDQTIYNSWVSPFLQVGIIQETDLASLPLVGNVTARPGTLVRFASATAVGLEVYLVTECRKIRRFVNDELIGRKFGPGWEAQVQRISQDSYSQYILGETFHNVEQIDLFGLSYRTLDLEIASCL